MNEKYIIERIKDSSEKVQYNLDLYARTHSTKHVNRLAFWSRAFLFWSNRLTEHRVFGR